MSRLYLQASHQPGEVLRQDLEKRLDVHFQPGDRKFLGRNSTTGIAAQDVMRKECTVEMEKDGSLLIANIKTSVWVNGMPLLPGAKQKLTEGLTISVLEGLYPYTVVSAEASVAGKRHSPSRKRTAAKAALPPSSPTPRKPAAVATPVKASSALSSATLEEFCCPVCLEIQVQATTLVPCGHSFCLACQRSASECPTCRARIQTRVPCRALNNVIAALASGGHFLDDEDVQHYHERMSAAGLNATTNAAVGVSPRRSRRRRGPPQPPSSSALHGASVVDAIVID